MMTAETVTLANMRSLGRRDILVYCGNAPRCWHHAKVNADRWPDGMAFSALSQRFVCTNCGTVGAEVRTDWGSGPDTRAKSAGG